MVAMALTVGGGWQIGDFASNQYKSLLLGLLLLLYLSNSIIIIIIMCIHSPLTATRAANLSFVILSWSSYSLVLFLKCFCAASGQSRSANLYDIFMYYCCVYPLSDTYSFWFAEVAVWPYAKQCTHKNSRKFQDTHLIHHTHNNPTDALVGFDCTLDKTHREIWPDLAKNPSGLTQMWKNLVVECYFASQKWVAAR